ncbi:hypothetical protein IGI04_033844 [Brassica rapa subsp. trilocularis]|uniref:IBB domain-containing protein n=1 Tax=Brassica rapa subsp. trilocularis TaxID=1813537 RepID=A0ABQ7L717_BRACM|nr:hypothetical protein IGI04_033844 [Brassica rapa subsp. trilocularis]
MAKKAFGAGNARERERERERERDLGSNDLPNLQREERRKRSNIWIRNKERRRCCPQLPDLALRLLHPEPTQCSFSIFAVSSSGSKWMLNTLSGKCLTFVLPPKLCKSLYDKVRLRTG